MTDMAFVQRVLDSLPHAISAIDAEGRFAFANAAFWRMLDVPRAACPLGSPVRVLVQRLAYRGLYGPGDPQAQVEAVLAIDRSRPTRRLVTRPDGSRSVEILSVPLPEGGYVNIGHDVTALVHAREEQAARARLLESTLAELNSGLLRFDPAMRISFHNAAYEAMVGLPGGAVRPGMTHRELVQLLERHGQFSGNDEAEEVLEILERDRVTAATRERRRPSGKVLRFDVRPTSDGGCQVEVTDISALKRAEDEARRRAALLDGILAALPHGVCVYGPDRRVAMVNEAYRCIMHGSPLEVGEHIEDIAARRIAEGEFSADYAADVLAYPFGPNGRLGERVRHRRNGTAISIRGAPLPDGGHISVVTDVTALHAAQQELRQRAALQEAMLGTIRHGIILYGPDRRLLAANAKTAELTGVPRDRLLPGRSMDELLDEEVARGQLTPEQAARMKGYDRSMPLRYARDCPDGRVLDTVSEPTPDGGFVITYSDVTEERTIRAELERARALAEAASEAKTRFLATMSHELRTPLNVVIGLSEALGRERDLSRAREYAEMMNEAGRHLLQLVDDILDVARSQADALTVADLPICSAEVVASAITAAMPMAKTRGLHLRSEFGERVPALRGDARRLRQVLDKLLSNALKFTPTGGSITVSAGLEGGSLVIRVADTGIGIPPEERERMFEPFTQLDSSLSRQFPGSGLGLHLARTLTIALGGALALEQPPGPGTVAVLRFPADRLLTISDDVPETAGALPG
jgi:signal transduction histidine kinase